MSALRLSIAVAVVGAGLGVVVLRVGGVCWEVLRDFAICWMLSLLDIGNGTVGLFSMFLEAGKYESTCSSIRVFGTHRG
jgi:hypothetical protein